ncbi:MAG TPA: alpha/beta fold hydrolase [Thermoanaerobaculia bacterium]|nr:alpha/beta fold hydrolase [Thermoanaerobaculia bacterium]
MNRPRQPLVPLVRGAFVVALLLGLPSPAALAEATIEAAITTEDATEQPVDGFPTLVRRPVSFWSDGTRLAGDLFYPKSAAAAETGDDGEKLPAIVLCHGWGGTKQHLNQQIAPQFAAAGYVVLAFDYRGWGESDSRLIVEGPMPNPDDDGFVTVKARAVREIVDPLDQQEDIDAAITFVEGEQIVDPERIGIWGSSFGGGHVVWRAGIDERVKAVVAQVGPMDQRSGLVESYAERGETLDALHREKIERVRGDRPPVPLDADKPEGLRGTPYYERFVDFVALEQVEGITAPVLFIDAENEHYFDIEEHAGRAHQMLKERGIPTEYHVFHDIGHYDIYRGDALARAMKLEIEWFDRHLGGKDEG